MDQNLKRLMQRVKQGDKQIIEKCVEISRSYVLNLAYSFTNDQEKAVEIAKETYQELIFGAKLYEGDSFSDILQQIVFEKAGARISTAKKAEKDPVSKQEALKEEADPALELAISEILGSLPEKEKELLLRVAYSDDSPKEIALAYGIDENALYKALSEAEENIRKQASSLRKKRKFRKIDFNKVESLLSVINTTVSVMNMEFDSLALDLVKSKVEDSLRNKDEEEGEEDLKGFVSGLIKDKVEDWFFDRVKKYLAGTLSALLSGGKKAADGAKAISGIVKSALLKKAAIAATAVVLTSGGVYTAYRETKRNEALQYMREHFHTEIFNSNDQVTAKELFEVLEVCFGLDRSFVYEDMEDETRLDDFFLMWPLVKYYWPEVEENWDVLSDEEIQASEWFPGLLTSEKFIKANHLTRGYNTNAKGINMKDFAILIMNCDRYYHENK